MAMIEINQYPKDDLFKIAFWNYEQSRLGSSPLINTDMLGRIKQLPRPTMRTRLNNAIQLIAASTDYTIGRTFSLDDPKFRVATFCRDPDEMWEINRYWNAAGVIDNTQIAIGYPMVSLTAQGLLAYDEIFSDQKQSAQCFIAMWFNDAVQSAFDEGIHPAIISAGYTPIRVDQVDHNGKIDDRIVAEIRRSRFMIADFTGHRGGVYYEAGLGHGLGIDVIFTCRSDHLDQLHFDVRQYATIVWSNPTDLKGMLLNRILATLGAGPNSPNAAPLP